MFGRRRREEGAVATRREQEAVATVDGPAEGNGRFVREPVPAERDAAMTGGDPGLAGRTAVRDREVTAVERRPLASEPLHPIAGEEALIAQRERFGGLNWGAAVFGWLVAVGIAVILLAILSAAGTALGLGDLSSTEFSKQAATIGVGGAIGLIVVLMIAYYAGGYVAGRMSRFDGGRQGLGVWLIGVITTILFAAAGAIFGSKYNVLSALNLPRIPIKEGTIVTGGIISLIVVLVGTLLAAVLGGTLGRRYHLRVDRAALP